MAVVIADMKMTSVTQFPSCDESGVRELFNLYYPSLVCFAQNYINDNEASKDVVQDVFLVLLSSRRKFDTINNLKAYLYQSVKNECLKYLRHEKVKERYVVRVLQDADDKETYLDYVLEEEVYTHLIREIELLPEQGRKVYLLALEGKSNQEIADELGVKITTVKSHKMTGKQILQQRLQGIMSLQIIIILLSL